MSENSRAILDLHIMVAQVNMTVGDIVGNIQKIKNYYLKAAKEKADLIIFPELTTIGYPPEDLLYDPHLPALQTSLLAELATITAHNHTGLLVGMPLWPSGKHIKPYNAAVLFVSGQEAGRCYKHHLPNYGVFDEQRYFESFPLESVVPLNFHNLKLGVMICEDMWFADVPAQLAEKQSDIFIVLNASPYELGKRSERLALAQRWTEVHKIPLVYANVVGGQDELVFDGASFAIDGKAKLCTVAPTWQEDLVTINLRNNNSSLSLPPNDHSDIYQAVMSGLQDYVYKNGFHKVLLGLSGGIDSAIVATIAADALGVENVRLVMLPSEFTSGASDEDAHKLLQRLPCQHHTLSITELHHSILAQLAPLFTEYQPDTTEENIQARLRGLLLMALSNKYNELLLATGNKSEYAVGYATLYGDMCGAFAPIKDIYKTQVYALAKWRNTAIPIGSKGVIAPIPTNMLVKAPTAELRYNQRDEDSLPPYPILDHILSYLIEGTELASDIDQAIVAKVKALLYRAEFKRRQAALGPKITTRSFDRDWRYPITGRVLSINSTDTDA